MIAWMEGFAALGQGLGLRPPCYEVIATGGVAPVAPVDWWEVISENFMGEGGKSAPGAAGGARTSSRSCCTGCRCRWGRRIRSDIHYLDRLAALGGGDRAGLDLRPPLLVELLGGHRGHDLWPLPFTEEALAHVVARVTRVQERLGRRIPGRERLQLPHLLRHSTLTEPEFLTAARRARGLAGLLLDVNNVFVSAHNHGFDAAAFLDAVPRGARRAVSTSPVTRRCRRTCATRTIIPCATAWWDLSIGGRSGGLDRSPR